MRKKAKILVLDDRRNWLFTIKNILDDEYELVLTTSPAQAQRKVREHDFALAILDQRLANNRTGLEVLGWLRRNAPALPAIICTAFADPADKKSSLKAGALGYIDKGDPDFGENLKRAISSHIKTRKVIKVFLSYQHEDRKKVDNLFNKLTAEGFVPWMDHKSAIKGEWWPQIKKAVEESDYFIACFSAGSLRKRQSVFRDELKLALKIERQLFQDEVFFVPVSIAECEIPETFKHYDFKFVYKKDGFAKLIKVLK